MFNSDNDVIGYNWHIAKKKLLSRDQSTFFTSFRTGYNFFYTDFFCNCLNEKNIFTKAPRTNKCEFQQELKKTQLSIYTTIFSRLLRSYESCIVILLYSLPCILLLQFYIVYIYI